MNNECYDALAHAIMRASPQCVQVSIWYGAVLRGDLNAIRVNSYSNIQDKSIIHAARCAHTLSQ